MSKKRTRVPKQKRLAAWQTLKAKLGWDEVHQWEKTPRALAEEIKREIGRLTDLNGDAHRDKRTDIIIGTASAATAYKAATRLRVNLSPSVRESFEPTGRNWKARAFDLSDTIERLRRLLDEIDKCSQTGQPDCKPDNERKSKTLPDNPNVTKLANRYNAAKEKTYGLKTQIAREICGENEGQVESLLRQARRFPGLFL